MMLAGVPALFAALLLAQNPKGTHHRKAAPAPATRKAGGPHAGGGDTKTETHAADDAETGAAKDDATGKASKTRVYTFGAMDVEGKLKTPQLLYFLNRVKLELEMSAPDKKSFMKDLAQSADDKNL